jgi:hypothetical protein
VFPGIALIGSGFYDYLKGKAHGAAQTKPLIARFSLSFGVESRVVESICALRVLGYNISDVY